MKKKLIFIFSLICLFFSSSAVTFALFYFSSDTTVIKNIYVDPIKENYDFSGSKYNSRDVFKVYFFPQSRYASGQYLRVEDYEANTNKPKDLTVFTSVNGGYNQQQALNNYNNNIKNITKSSVLSYIPKDVPKDVNGTIKAPFNGKFKEGGLENNREVTGRFGDYDGYFTNVPVADKYKPKIVDVDSAITDEILTSVGNPFSKMEDYRGYGMPFCGWTMNQKTALDLGYGGTGDYNVIDTNYPLFLIDQIKRDGKMATSQEIDDAKSGKTTIIGIDGSNICDGDIFLYPIFSSGKDYYLYKPNDSIYISNNIGNQMYMYKFNDSSFSYKANNTTHSGTAYVAKDLTINSNDASNVNSAYHMKAKFYYSSFLSGSPQWAEAAHNGVVKAVKVNNSTSNLPTNLKLDTLNLISQSKKTASDPNPTLPREGHYNIYMYVLNTSYYKGDMNKFNYTATTLPAALKGKKISDIYEIQNQSWSPGAFVTNKNVRAWIFVEEKQDYKIFGGNILSFDFRSSNANICHAADTEGKSYISTNTSFTKNRGRFNYLTTEKDSNGKNITLNHTFNNNVFSVAQVSSNPSVKINSNYDIVIKDTNPNVAGIQNDYLEVAKPYQYDASGKIISGDYDIKNVSSTKQSLLYTQLNGKLLKIKDKETVDDTGNKVGQTQEGYFRITCRISTTTVSGKERTQIEVDATKVKVPLFISIYSKSSDIITTDKKPIETTKGFIDFTAMNTQKIYPKYLCSDNLFNSLKAKDPVKYKDLKPITLGDRLTSSTVFVKIEVSIDPNTKKEVFTFTPMTIKEIQIAEGFNDPATGKLLYEAVTNSPLVSGSDGVMLRNRVFYIH